VGEPQAEVFPASPVVMEVFRGKFSAYLEQALKGGELRLPDELPPSRLERLLKKLKGLNVIKLNP
jgi:hypothetical protein